MNKLASFFNLTGYCIAQLALAFRFTPRIFFRWRTLVREMWIVGIESLPLSCFFLFLIGMVSALQTGITLAQYGSEQFVGQILAAAMVRELGPWMTAFVLVARNGSSMAAEIGTMSVSEEISALKLMSIEAADFIVMPRLWAFLVMAPILTVISTAVGISGGFVVAVFQLQTEPYVFLNEMVKGLEPAMVIYWGVLKSFVFALITVGVAAGIGLRTSGGALGVGKASRDTVVYSLVLIVFFNFILTSLYIVMMRLLGDNI